VLDQRGQLLQTAVGFAGCSLPTWNGYRLTVACPCGVVFERWVTPEDADDDLFRLASLN